MSVLELRSISKVFGKGAAQVQALRDVTMSVEAGSMVAIMGPSGSGKSSLLTIAGTIETKSGQLSLGQISGGATFGGILIALGVLVMTVGLIRAETAGDLPPAPGVKNYRVRTRPEIPASRRA